MKKFTTKQLVVISLLVSLNIVLQGMFKIDFAGVTQFGFSFIPSALIGIIFGPIAGFITGALADVVSFFVFPSNYPFFIGFTLSSAIGPMIYGLFLYGKKLTLARVFGAVLFITLFVNLGLITLWVSILQGKAFLALLPIRATKNAVSLFLNTFILSSLLSTPFIQSLIRKYTTFKGEY